MFVKNALRERMPGRKQPEMTDNERRREYRMMQKRGYGEEVVGDEAKHLGEGSPAADMAKEREKWMREHGRER